MNTLSYLITGAQYKMTVGFGAISKRNIISGAIFGMTIIDTNGQDVYSDITYKIKT